MRALDTGVLCFGLDAPSCLPEDFQPGVGMRCVLSPCPPPPPPQRLGGDVCDLSIVTVLGSSRKPWIDAIDAGSSCRPGPGQGEKQTAKGTPYLRGLLSPKAQLNAVEYSSLHLINQSRNIHDFQGYFTWLFLMRLLASRNNNNSFHL